MLYLEQSDIMSSKVHWKMTLIDWENKPYTRVQCSVGYANYGFNAEFDKFDDYEEDLQCKHCKKQLNKMRGVLEDQKRYEFYRNKYGALLFLGNFKMVGFNKFDVDYIIYQHCYSGDNYQYKPIQRYSTIMTGNNMNKLTIEPYPANAQDKVLDKEYWTNFYKLTKL